MIPVIVVMWSEKNKLFKIEGNHNGNFVVAVGDTEAMAMARWRREAGYPGEVKMKTAVGKICPKHKELEGLRYVPNRLCVECAKDYNRKRHAARAMTVSAEIKALKAEVQRLGAVNRLLMAELAGNGGAK